MEFFKPKVWKGILIKGQWFVKYGKGGYSCRRFASWQEAISYALKVTKKPC